MISFQRSMLRNLASVTKALSGERYLGVVCSFVAGVLGRANFVPSSGALDALAAGGACAFVCAWVTSWVLPEQ